MALTIDQIRTILQEESTLLDHTSKTISKDMLTKPSGNFVDEIFGGSNRSMMVRDNLKRLYGTGRLANSGYISILPVDQGIEHGAGYSFASNPMYFDPENIVRLAIDGGCNAVASTFGVLGMLSDKYAGQIPFIVKINHNELLSYPNKYDQVLFGNVKDAYNMGAVAVGATVYFGSEHSRRQISEIAEAFALAHELGLATILWCYTRNDAFVIDGKDMHTSADISGQANHLGVTIQADIIKQKLSTTNGVLKALNSNEQKFSKYSSEMDNLIGTHDIDLNRYQVANCYMGRIGLISSGGEATDNDEKDAVKCAVINKRAGGHGLIMGRKAFKKPFDEGIRILNLVQDVYLCEEVELA